MPDHLVNFAIEFSIVQRKFNDLLDLLVALAKPVVEKIGKSTQQAQEKMLEEGRARNLWAYSSVDYEREEVRKAVAALLVKEQAVEARGDNLRSQGGSPRSHSRQPGKPCG